MADPRQADPRAARRFALGWASDMIVRLRDESALREVEAEQLALTANLRPSSSSSDRHSNAPRIRRIRHHLSNFRFHIDSLTAVRDRLGRGAIDVARLIPLRHPLEFYVENYEGSSVSYLPAARRDFYDGLGLDVPEFGLERLWLSPLRSDDDGDGDGEEAGGQVEGGRGRGAANGHHHRGRSPSPPPRRRLPLDMDDDGSSSSGQESSSNSRRRHAQHPQRGGGKPAIYAHQASNLNLLSTFRDMHSDPDPSSLGPYDLVGELGPALRSGFVPLGPEMAANLCLVLEYLNDASEVCGEDDGEDGASARLVEWVVGGGWMGPGGSSREEVDDYVVDPDGGVRWYERRDVGYGGNSSDAIVAIDMQEREEYLDLAAEAMTDPRGCLACLRGRVGRMLSDQAAADAGSGSLEADGIARVSRCLALIERGIDDDSQMTAGGRRDELAAARDVMWRVLKFVVRDEAEWLECEDGTAVERFLADLPLVLPAMDDYDDDGMLSVDRNGGRIRGSSFSDESERESVERRIDCVMRCSEAVERITSDPRTDMSDEVANRLEMHSRYLGELLGALVEADASDDDGRGGGRLARPPAPLLPPGLHPGLDFAGMDPGTIRALYSPGGPSDDSGRGGSSTTGGDSFDSIDPDPNPHEDYESAEENGGSAVRIPVVGRSNRRPSNCARGPSAAAQNVRRLGITADDTNYDGTDESDADSDADADSSNPLTPRGFVRRLRDAGLLQSGGFVAAFSLRRPRPGASLECRREGLGSYLRGALGGRDPGLISHVGDFVDYVFDGARPWSRSDVGGGEREKLTINTPRSPRDDVDGDGDAFVEECRRALAARSDLSYEEECELDACASRSVPGGREGLLHAVELLAIEHDGLLARCEGWADSGRGAAGLADREDGAADDDDEDGGSEAAGRTSGGSNKRGRDDDDDDDDPAGALPRKLQHFI